MSDVSLKHIDVGTGADARRIAVRVREGAGPGVFWLGGFMSDMRGTKIEALDACAAAQGRGCVRFDYSGHGESGGAIAEGSIGRWLEESLAVFRSFCRGPQVVVGSSMGGWMALLLARALAQGAANGEAAPARPCGMVLVAPAPDFTEVLMWQRFTPEIRRQIEERGSWTVPSEYSDEPYLVTRRLIEDGRRHLIMGGLIETGCPVRILQGVKDRDVPWQHAAELVTLLAREDVVFTLIKDGDHRLSRPEDIERLIAAVAEFH